MPDHVTVLFSILPLLYLSWPDEEEFRRRAKARKERLAQERLHPPTTVAALKGSGKRHADMIAAVGFYIFVPAFEFRASLEHFILTGLAMFIMWGMLIQRQINSYT